MHELAAVSGLALTVSLTLRRPTLPHGLRIGPGLAAALGVGVLAAAGDIEADDVSDALDILWRPFIALASIMVMTGVAARLGTMDQLARIVFRQPGLSAGHLFALVFLLSLGTAAVLNNDAAILLLTPTVVLLVRRLYPHTESLVVPFAFAVFMGAGVAPFVTSNPMNTVVAGVADIDFNGYATRMVPVALAGSLITFVILRRLFRRELRDAPAPAKPGPPPAWRHPQLQALVLLFVVLGSYPVLALLGLQVFIVAAAGAAAGLALAWRHGAGRPAEVVRSSVAWEILLFLFGMFVLAQGLQNVGVVDELTKLYAGAGLGVIGATSAIGSALLNNHSMALTNLLAIGDLPGAGRPQFLAALIGGDLGPRLLPIGSLAGLLWLTLLARFGVHVSLKRFVVVGAAVTVPSLAASLAVLALF